MIGPQNTSASYSLASDSTVAPLVRPEGIMQGQKSNELTELVQTLGSKYQGLFEEWRMARQPTEDEWLKDLRAFNSQYDADIMARIRESDSSEIYISLTHTKTMAAYSRIIDMLFSSSLKPWGVSETPVPDVMPREEDMLVFKKAQQEIITALESGNLPPEADPSMLIRQKMKKLRAEFTLQKKSEARDAAILMTEQIDDQLKECNFESHAKNCILESCIVGNGAVKGATLKIDRQHKWDMPTPDSPGWTVGVRETARPDTQNVSVFDLYPDPYSADLKEIPAIFQEHTMTRSQVLGLTKNKSFNADIITEILRNHPHGNHVDRPHEIERRRIGRLTSIGSSGRFRVLEYWGPVDGGQLIQYGLNVTQPLSEYQVNMWICEGKVLMVRFNPMAANKHPYSIVPFERTPHSLWGIGPPRMMRDSQATLNTAGRMMLDNLGITAGPQIEVNLDMLADGANPNEVYPFKVWLREGGDPSTPMVRFNQPNNNTGAMLGVMNLFREYADEETSLPRYMHGEKSGATRTKGGMSMLMAAANLSIKSVIKNVDDYMFEPVINSMYDWNMQWNPREDIKGDMRVVAQGSTSLVAREVQSERMIQFANMTSAEFFASEVNHRAILEEIARSMELPPSILKPEGPMTEEEMVMKQIQQKQIALEMAIDEAKISKLQAEAHRATKEAETIGMMREAESQKDMAVAQRAVADIALQQGESVAAPPLPRRIRDLMTAGGVENPDDVENAQEGEFIPAPAAPESPESPAAPESPRQMIPPNREVASQMQFA
jgi:hypothetical protein